jgi:hypothetical protein
MPKPKKRPSINAKADRFYDYLQSHRGQVLRYITAALVTGLIQFLLEYFKLTDGLIAMFLRLTLLFPIAKYWVYTEKEKPVFYVLRQIMLAFMVILLMQTGVYFLIAACAKAFGGGTLIRYIGLGVMEILLFLIFQFMIFKEKKD